MRHNSDRRFALPAHKEVDLSSVLATPRHLTPLDPAPVTAVPSRTGSALGALWESKEIVFILVGIAIAFTVHFGFGDFVQTESSTPKLRTPAPAASEIGVSDRVRAAAFERAARRSGAGQKRKSRAAKRAAAVASAPVVRRSAPSPRPLTATPRVSSPVASPAPAPLRRQAVSKPRSSPARNTGGGGGQSFDDSG
jgi:hypothetical protein